jgi:hypothetical protein
VNHYDFYITGLGKRQRALLAFIKLHFDLKAIILDIRETVRALDLTCYFKKLRGQQKIKEIFFKRRSGIIYIYCTKLEKNFISFVRNIKLNLHLIFTSIVLFCKSLKMCLRVAL